MTPTEQGELGLNRYTDVISDVLATRAVTQSWNKKLSEASTAGEKSAFLRAERATAKRQLESQKSRFRKEHVQLARDYDEMAGILTVWADEVDGGEEGVRGYGERCRLCGIEGNGVVVLRKCVACKGFYCTRYCQKADWSLHKTLCSSRK